tara:strand:- start:2969 stop:3130 length:162 start_codon:yes stop_codon:yes gene_type:complete
MSKLLIISLLFLTACSSNLEKNDFKFSNKMNFEQFKNKLLEYAEKNPFPNIDY